MDLFLQISGWIIGLVGLGYAVYANRENARIKDFARSEAWHLYLLANTACGNVQEALKLYKNNHQADFNFDVVESLSKADAKTLSVYHAAVRQVQAAEPAFDEESIQSWVDLGKITPAHQESFIKIMVSYKPTKRSKTMASNNSLGQVGG